MTALIARPTIFVDGPDGAGKSTLIPYLRRDLNHAAQVWERWVGSDVVYASLAEPQLRPYRESDARFHTQPWAAVFGDLWQVILVPPTPTLERRTEADPPQYPVDAQRTAFLDWAKACAALDPRRLKTVVVDYDDVSPYALSLALADLVASLGCASGLVYPGRSFLALTREPTHIAGCRVDTDIYNIPTGAPGHVVLRVRPDVQPPERQGEPA